MDYDFSMTERYDTALLGILQHEGQIAKFLNVIMGFLYRRTDFFLIMPDKQAKMGFPPGIASKILYEAFKKYDKLAEAKRHQEAEKIMIPDKINNYDTEMTTTDTPPVASTVEVTTEDAQPQVDVVNDPAAVNGVSPHTAVATGPEHHADPTVKATETPCAPATNEAAALSRTSTQPPATPTPEPPSPTPEAPSPTPEAPSPTPEAPSRNLKPPSPISEPPIVPAEPEDQEHKPAYVADAECYNGATRDNYSWSQSITDLDVYVQVPSHIEKGKQVKVSVERKHIRVSYAGCGGGWEEAVNGAMCWEVKADDSVWTLVPKKHVHINFEKVMERWWEALLTDEPRINVTKIDASRPMSDLGDEEQAKLSELMFNQQQKQLGLPQSHEIKTQELLKKAWDAEGSPFKGQPYDPSRLNIDPGSLSSLQ